MPFQRRSTRVTLLAIPLPAVLEAEYGAGKIQRCYAVVLLHLVVYWQLQDVSANVSTLSAVVASFLQALHHTGSQGQDLYDGRLLARLEPRAYRGLLFRDHGLCWGVVVVGDCVDLIPILYGPFRLPYQSYTPDKTIHRENCHSPRKRHAPPYHIRHST